MKKICSKKNFRQGSREFRELCPQGVGRGDGGRDLDECAMLGPDLVCGAGGGGRCVNVDGGYRCECPDGYVLDAAGEEKTVNFVIMFSPKM